VQTAALRRFPDRSVVACALSHYVRGMAKPLESVEIRLWRKGDEGVLPKLANNRRIWRNLTNRFPHPYGRDDAVSWIELANCDLENAQHFAIVAEGEVVGGVGFERLQDLSTRSAEIGYWIGEPYWERGIATLALQAATTLAFNDFDFARLQAGVLEWNPASCRVLEKAGFTREGVYRNHIFKDGELCDQIMYAKLREEHTSR
jgi:ribosomal-protein-alanine N-acetyltransferase